MAKDTTPVEATDTVVDAPLETTEIAPVVETAPASSERPEICTDCSGYCQLCGKTVEPANSPAE